MEERVPPWFPAWCIEFSEPVNDVRAMASNLMEHRDDSRWMLLGYPTATSERHLWAAWMAVRERASSGQMVSNSIDGEFLRLMAGTHQMRVAFSRAGVREGDNRAWLLRLPEWNDGDEVPELTVMNPELNHQADSLMGWIGAELIALRPHPTLEGMVRLGAIEDDEEDPANWESLALSHIALADVAV